MDERKNSLATPEDLARRLRDDQRVNPLPFRGGAGEPEIAAAEAALGVSFPERYRWFLREFGGGEVFVEIFGVDSLSGKTVTQETQRLRRSGWRRLPRSLIVFGSGYHWVAFNRWVPRYVCFDQGRRKDGEPTVTDWIPGARWREQIDRTGLTFLEWLSEQLDRIDQFIDQPRDWNDNSAWERYWSRIVADPHRRQWEAWSTRPGVLLGHLDLFRERALLRILCAGNGISLEPYCLRHCGFDVTVVDVSAAACRFVREAALGEDDLVRFLPEFEYTIDPWGIKTGRVNPAASRDRVTKEHRPGGRLEVIQADLFQYSPDRPFQVVYSRRAFQGFPDAARRELARRFFEWTLPGGVSLVETLNVHNAADSRTLEQAFVDAGFFVHGAETNAWYEREARGRHWPLTKAAEHRLLREYRSRMQAEAEREAGRLDSGEKMAQFCHGSG